MVTQVINIDGMANIYESAEDFFLITSLKDKPSEYLGFDMNALKAHDQGKGTSLSTPSDYHDASGLLLTANDTIETVKAVLNQTSIKLFVVYVLDFKDGRVFSLVRQLRQLDTQARIIVAGEFGLDQASYFYKSGADGFVVSPERITLLKSTLNDLKTAHAGTSANALPMFC
ncbi:DUF934 domain-containing protein [Moraxella sp. Pampa]|uniref:DUF934 domain-containing protein n=1 Tax=Moraxella sp. Pampa TaxID=3111978 RepID=UPI002B408B97|nr:DUF934 domain-containing protein [Moraxella sp. Pampa]